MRIHDKNNSPPFTLISHPEALGRFLRDVRKKAGLTQIEAAGLCNVGVRFLNELEHGKVTTALGKVLQVLQGYGIHLYAFRRGQEPRS